MYYMKNCNVSLMLISTCVQIVGEAFIWTLETGLGDKFTPEVKEAWTTFYKMVGDKMKEGLHEAYDIIDDQEA